MNKKGFGVYTLLLVFTALVIGYAVSQMHIHGTNFDINSLKNNLTWKQINISLNETPELGNALQYYINGLGGAVMEITKWVTQYSYDNPAVPWKLFLYLFLLMLLMPIIVGLVKILIIIFLLIKEYFQNRKERKRFKR